MEHHQILKRWWALTEHHPILLRLHAVHAFALCGSSFESASRRIPIGRDSFSQIGRRIRRPFHTVAIGTSDICTRRSDCEELQPLPCIATTLSLGIKVFWRKKREPKSCCTCFCALRFKFRKLCLWVSLSLCMILKNVFGVHENTYSVSISCVFAFFPHLFHAK